MSELDYQKIAKILGGTLHDIGPQTFGRAPMKPGPAPLTDADIRRRVAVIAGWKKLGPYEGDLGGYGPGNRLYRDVVPHFERSADAVLPVLQKWCMKHKRGFGIMRTLAAPDDIGCSIYDCALNAISKTVSASDPHAFAKAMALALIAADEAVKKAES